MQSGSSMDFLLSFEDTSFLVKFLLFIFQMIVGGILVLWILWKKWKQKTYSPKDELIQKEEDGWQDDSIPITNKPFVQRIILAVGLLLITYGIIECLLNFPKPQRSSANQTAIKPAINTVMAEVSAYHAQHHKPPPPVYILNTRNIVINVSLFGLITATGIYCLWKSRFRFHQQAENPKHRVLILRIAVAIIILSGIAGMIQCLVQII